MIKHSSLLLFLLFLNTCGFAQIIDYAEISKTDPNKRSTSITFDHSINIPKINDKIAIFIFEKRDRNFDPDKISLSEQLSTTDIDFDKFIIYRFNLVSGVCVKFDSSKYILNGMQWFKPKSININKYLVCIAVPDTTAYNYISKELGQESFDKLDQYPKKINYKTPIAFVSFNDQYRLDDKFLSLISKKKNYDFQIINNRLSDSILNLRKIIDKNSPSIFVGSFYTRNVFSSHPSPIVSNKQHTWGLAVGRAINFKKRKLETTLILSHSELDLESKRSPEMIYQGLETDEFSDFYYSYYKIPIINEALKYTSNSLGLGLKAYLGRKNKTFLQSSINYNFSGHTNQSFDHFDILKYGIYPVLNFDTLNLGYHAVSGNNFAFSKTFVCCNLEIGRQFCLIKDALSVNISAVYQTSENILKNSDNRVFQQINGDVKFNSSLNSLNNFRIEGINFKCQLRYEF